MSAAVVSGARAAGVGVRAVAGRRAARVRARPEGGSRHAYPPERAARRRRRRAARLHGSAWLLRLACSPHCVRLDLTGLALTEVPLAWVPLLTSAVRCGALAVWDMVRYVSGVYSDVYKTI